jgi:hypothetical protein
VQGSGYKACTGKYCIICPGGTKKNLKKDFRAFNSTLLFTILKYTEKQDD